MYKRKVNITRVKRDQKSEKIDIVLIESAIDIIVNSKSIVNIVCLPYNLKELAIGFIYSIGIINSIDDIKSIKIDELESRISIDLKDSLNVDLDILNLSSVNRVIDTTCGIPSPWRNTIKNLIKDSKQSSLIKKDIQISSKTIFSSIIEMQKQTRLFRETGGCHGAAIFDLNGTSLSVKEDIGRHNAIDKVIGDLLIRKENLNNKLLTTTGRLTGDSVLKAVRAKIPILASLSAAIESGIRLAFAYGITLIGFVRGNKMNIYTHPSRVKI
ncbi:MAG: formate dehydrogenase accessory sulfurtransferase FdhD [Candidatus Thorarchaeota archaeon]